MNAALSEPVTSLPSPGKVRDLVAESQALSGIPVIPAQSAIARGTYERMRRSNEARKRRGRFGGLTLCPLEGQTHAEPARFFQMNNAWGGLDHGVHLVGGETNLGKSSLIRCIAYDIIRFNPKAHVRFYTLDDAEDYFLDSFVAQAANVPINAIAKPEGFVNKPEGFYKKRDYERMVERGNAMYSRFLAGEFSECFSFTGVASLQSTEWPVIEADIRRTREQLPADVELVCCIDNFHDVEIPGREGDINARTEETATRAGKLCDQLGITMLGTAELKKNNQRRPTLDDIFGSRKWKYKARSVILLYSEVGVQKPNPRIYYERPDHGDEQCSVLEVHFVKSKGNEFKGRLFYRQLTDVGTMVEVPKDEAAAYAMLIS